MVKPEYGAPLVPQPVARTSEEAGSPEFYRRLKGAEARQRMANATAQTQSITTTQHRGRAQSQPDTAPAGPRGSEGGATAACTVMSTAPPALAAPQAAKIQSEVDHDRGAAVARELLSGDGMASPVGAAPATRLAAVGTGEEERTRGEAAVISLIGTPEEQRANRTARASGLCAGSSDAAAGAAEARSLLGID